MFSKNSRHSVCVSMHIQMLFVRPMKDCIPVRTGRYQHYLESVLEGADEFHEVGDLMLRHATLAATNQDLKEQRNHFGEAAEQTRSALHTCLHAFTHMVHAHALHFWAPCLPAYITPLSALHLPISHRLV